MPTNHRTAEANRGDQPLWHGLPVEQVRQQLDAAQEGLSAGEAARRQEVHGLNEIEQTQSRSLWRIALEQFSDFMIVVLLLAAAVSGFLGEPEDAIAIVAIVILNAVIGFVQEFRAQKALEALRKMAAHQARVVRDGETITIPAAELVPGDQVLLEAGNAVPADLRVSESAQLRIDEAALTGESQPVEKRRAPVEANHDLPLGDRASMAYKGTLVTYGRGRGIVVATGMQSELGKIAGLLRNQVEVKTPLQKRLAGFGKYLALGALGICAIIFLVGLQRGEPAITMFLTAVSLAVAAIPEALPAVVTIALALGARRMLKAKALVRRLPAVETLGSVTYICTDKTGTLTENRMQVTRLWVDGELRDAPQKPDAEDIPEPLLLALALSNDASPEKAGPEKSEGSKAGAGDPTEVALMEAAEAAGFLKAELEQRYPRIAEAPFDSDRKRMATVHRAESGVLIFVKGAPEAVLERCERLRNSNGDVELDRAAILETAEQMAAEGLRVLAIAMREADQGPADGDNAAADELEQDLTLLGLAGLIDPPRPEAAGAVRECRQAGITPVMITGDHPATALAIARDLGIAADDDEAVTGVELARLSWPELEDHVRRYRVYARVSPEQKLRIVEALQKQGEFVAMTGDGVNDAPALQRSDIGVAMGKIGTDVAREAGDIVLLDDNFATIVGAVREGRHIFDNIRKFVRYTMTSNSAEILTIFVAPLLGMPVPLLPIHILWINLVTDGLPGLALATEPAERGVMHRPPRPPTESLFAHGMLRHMIWVGMLMAGLSIFSQAWLMEMGSDRWQTMVFMVLTLTQMGHVMAIRSEVDSLFRIGLFSNRPLLGAVLLTVVLQFAVVYVPFLQEIFKTDALSGSELAMALALALVVLTAVEIEKWFTRRSLAEASPPDPAITL